MTSFFTYSITPTPFVPDGLQARADWDIPSPISPSSLPPSVPPNSPLAYATSSHNCDDESHCPHARLCEQRFADLLADLERSQWSLKKRLSLRSGRRSAEAPNTPASEEDALNSAGGDFRPPLERPATIHPPSPAKELLAISEPVELHANQAFTPELPVYHFDEAGTPTANMALYAFPSEPYPNSFGYSHDPYVPNTGMGSLPELACLPQAQAVHSHELAAHVPNPNPHTPAWYSGMSPTSFVNTSATTQYTSSTPGSRSLVSPQSTTQFPGASLAGFATNVTAAGALSFTTQMTSSPVEYGEIAPWHNTQALPSHKNSWDSTTTAVEPHDSSSYPVLGATQWLPDSAFRPLPELEGAMQFMKPSMLPLPQHFGGAQPTSLPELATEANNVKVALDTSLWQTAHMMGRENHPMTSAPYTPQPSYFKAHASPIRPGPRPLMSQSRQHSYDSSADTILDFPMLPDQHPYPQDNNNNNDNTSTYPSTPPNFNPPASDFQFQFQWPLPSQQKRTPIPATPKPQPPDRRTRIRARNQTRKPTTTTTITHQPLPFPETIVSCPPCNYYPASGPGQRRKMEKHKLTDGHLRRTGLDGGNGGVGDGDGEGGGEMRKRKRFPCWVAGCRSTFNRGDNLQQHVGKKHGLEGLKKGMGGEGGTERAPGRRGRGRAGRLDVGVGMGKEVRMKGGSSLIGPLR